MKSFRGLKSNRDVIHEGTNSNRLSDVYAKRMVKSDHVPVKKEKSNRSGGRREKSRAILGGERSRAWDGRKSPRKSEKVMGRKKGEERKMREKFGRGRQKSCGEQIIKALGKHHKTTLGSIIQQILLRKLIKKYN